MKNKLGRGFIDLTILFIIIVIVLGLLLTTGFKSKSPQGTDNLVPDNSTGGSSPGETEKQSLQLQTLKFKKAPLVDTCRGNKFNSEPDIIYGSDPAFGGTAKAGGQISIWVWEDDGTGASVASGTQVDRATGRIIATGDTSVADSNGYLWHPAIYITKLTGADDPGPYAGDKENGGTPHFPTIIKGVANKRPDFGPLTSIPIDPPQNVQIQRTGPDWTYSQFVWDVNAMGLTEPGYYHAQIIMHDGDSDLAVNCTTIQI